MKTKNEETLAQGLRKFNQNGKFLSTLIDRNMMNYYGKLNQMIDQEQIKVSEDPI